METLRKCYANAAEIQKKMQWNTVDAYVLSLAPIRPLLYASAQAAVFSNLRLTSVSAI
jgi:hypothetical protein